MAAKKPAKKSAKKPAKKKVPAALAERAHELADAAKKRLLKQAREDIALIKRRKAEISEAFYDIGEALLRLRKDPIPKLLGYDGFAELCTGALAISPTTAGELIDVVERLSRRDALRWGKEKAHALVALADATPAKDSPQKIDAKVLGGRDPKAVSVRELRDLAKKERAKKPQATHRGRSATAQERAVAAKLQAALHMAGHRDAEVAAVATRPGAPSKLRIELPIDALDALAKALRS